MSRFHPGGQTALIVGDHGVVLRYAQDQSLERAVPDVSLDYAMITQLNSWSAYVGTEEGRFGEEGGKDGGAELRNYLLQEQEITAIDSDTIMMCS